MLLIAPPPQSYDILRDPIWQFISVIAAILFGIVAVAGLIIAVKAYRQQNKRKELTYQIEDDTPLVRVDKTLKSDVEIRYRGNVVENVRLVLIKVWNSGALAVKREDYEEPIAFEITGRKCLNIQVNSEPQEFINPENLNDILTVEENFVKLSPVLLNPADTIALRMLVSGQGKIRGTARLIDGKLIEFDPTKQPNTYSLRVLLFLILFSTVGFVFAEILSASSSHASINYLGLILGSVFISAILCLFFLISPSVVKRGIKIKW